MDIYLDVYKLPYIDCSYTSFIYFLSDEDFDEINCDNVYYYIEGIKGFEKRGLEGRFYRLSDMAKISEILSKHHFISDDFNLVVFSYGFLSRRGEVIVGGFMSSHYVIMDRAFRSRRDVVNICNYKGQLHNELGFARILYTEYDKYEEYWLEGEKLSKEEWEQKMSVKLYW